MKQVIILLVAFVLGWELNAQNTYVVSVGICDYNNEQVNDLKYTENDVDKFNEVMSRHTKQITTIKGKQATHTNVLSTLQKVFTQAQPEDAVIFFFSGHGSPSGFCCVDVGPNGGELTYRELQAVFKQCRAKRKMIFSDSCYSGKLRQQGTGNSTQTNKDSDILFFLSSRTNETSQEMLGGPNGQFTRFLVRGLTGGADVNRDRLITAKELYNFVHEGVIVATAKKQHPVMWGKFSDQMVILNWH